MDITVSIPDKHLARVAAAYSMELGLDAPLQVDPESGEVLVSPHVLRDGTAAQKKSALVKYFHDTWASEVRSRVAGHEANTAAREAAEAKRAELGEDPLK